MAFTTGLYASEVGVVTVTAATRSSARRDHARLRPETHRESRLALIAMPLFGGARERLRSRVYGSRRMMHEVDEPIGRNHLARLMRENGLLACAPRRFRVTTDSAHALPVVSNLLEQDFDVDEPNRVWAGDISVPQQAAREMRVGPS